MNILAPVYMSTRDVAKLHVFPRRWSEPLKIDWNSFWYLVRNVWNSYKYNFRENDHSSPCLHFDLVTSQNYTFFHVDGRNLSKFIGIVFDT